MTSSTEGDQRTGTIRIRTSDEDDAGSLVGV